MLPTIAPTYGTQAEKATSFILSLNTSAKYNGRYVTNIHQIGSRKKRPNITDQFLRLDNNSDKLLPFCLVKSILHSGWPDII